MVSVTVSFSGYGSLSFMCLVDFVSLRPELYLLRNIYVSTEQH